LAEKITYGPLDPETQELFEQVLNQAQRFVDLQVDDEIYEEYQRDIDELATRFDIVRQDIEVDVTEDQPDDDGNTVVKIKFKPSDRKTLTQDQLRKTLKVITNETNDNEETDG
tara:strand:- start:222 stop:560 length:339 start_codon:yes stop_codon:yes gene_type:complete